MQAADDQTYGEAYPYTPFPAENDNDKAKEALYCIFEYYYGEEAAKISYEGSIFPATNYDGIAATDSQYAMNAMIDSTWKWMGNTKSSSGPDSYSGSSGSNV